MYEEVFLVSIQLYLLLANQSRHQLASEMARKTLFFSKIIDLFKFWFMPWMKRALNI